MFAIEVRKKSGKELQIIKIFGCWALKHSCFVSSTQFFQQGAMLLPLGFHFLCNNGSITGNLPSRWWQSMSKNHFSKWNLNIKIFLSFKILIKHTRDNIGIWIAEWLVLVSVQYQCGTANLPLSTQLSTMDTWLTEAWRRYVNERYGIWPPPSRKKKSTGPKEKNVSSTSLPK